MITSPPLSNSCASDVIDDTDLDLELTEVLQLPLKSSRCLSNNFSELLLEHKKAKVTSPSENNEVCEKRHVEELLQDASQLNGMFERTADNNDSFRSDLLQRSWYSGDRCYSNTTTSNVSVEATAPSSTTCGSMTNFRLSEVESDDEISFEDHLKRVISKRLALKKLKRDDDSKYDLSDRTTDSGALSNSPAPVLFTSPYSQTHTPIKDNILPTQQIIEGTGAGSYKEELSADEALKLFKDDIEAVLKLSQTAESDCNYRDPFEMKCPATVTYQQYLDRINTKCMFSALVYRTANCLFQRLTLQRPPTEAVDPPQEWKVKWPITNAHIHRLIVALIRISNKILEDTVHSHEYFSKVCGISKKLLTKLEVSLILALRTDSLMISSSCLNNSFQLHTALERQISMSS
ncbi:uncharacterized protein Ecym_2180 [Eremothecium cymbalariae DBVPG|uniref:Uncharacterized protein n=1 Tax=Eremothecium cymbalariae (strain CBS 270.75 / DBVPG 7215 / KCTC 17166 / NRRL Y-17582) TaxID=931890 RepID=G8JP25_ERECY|nr:Hypothetical protein Ecym_2180 [Eremothecium cymbalariae DBVPG\